MFRKALWLVFSLFPIAAFTAFVSARDPADLSVWGLSLIAHYFFFLVHPFFNGAVSDMKRKAGWSVMTLILYPLAPPLYAWFCIGTARAESEATAKNK